MAQKGHVWGRRWGGPRIREDTGRGRAVGESPTGENVVWCGSHPYPFDKLRAGSSLPHVYTHQGGRELQARNGLFS